MRKILLLAALAITPLLLSEEASAQCGCGYGRGYGQGYGYGVYPAPVLVAPYNNPGGFYAAPYRSGYGGCGSYRSHYRHGSRYGRYGFGYPYYGRRSRGGVGIYFGF